MTQVYPLAINLNREAGLTSYVQAINNLPVFTADEEKRLARLHQENGDLDAARQLVMSQLRSVVRVAKGFTGYGLPLGDLIQEGNIGLMKAVKHFDPDHGVRLISFAVHWIRAEIYDFILKNWRIVKVATTKSQRKLFFNLRKTRKHLGWMSRKEVTDLAEKLDVSKDTVYEMEARMTGNDVGFDSSSDNDDEFQAAPVGYLQDMRYNPEVVASNADQKTEQDNLLATAMSALDERSRDIVQQRWLSEKKATLHELADKYGVSAERVRQIEKKAMEKMKDGMLTV